MLCMLEMYLLSVAIRELSALSGFLHVFSMFLYSNVCFPVLATVVLPGLLEARPVALCASSDPPCAVLWCFWSGEGAPSNFLCLLQFLWLILVRNLRSFSSFPIVRGVGFLKGTSISIGKVLWWGHLHFIGNPLTQVRLCSFVISISRIPPA